MAKRGIRQQLVALSDDELIDEIFSRAHPNAKRIGCPSRDVLIELAHRVRPIGDPWYEHCAHCSSCYLEARTIQRVQGHIETTSVN